MKVVVHITGLVDGRMTELYVADNEKVTTEFARARRFGDQIEAIAHVAERVHLFFSNPRYERADDTADQHSL